MGHIKNLIMLKSEDGLRAYVNGVGVNSNNSLIVRYKITEKYFNFSLKPYFLLYVCLSVLIAVLLLTANFIHLPKPLEILFFCLAGVHIIVTGSLCWYSFLLLRYKYYLEK